MPMGMNHIHHQAAQLVDSSTSNSTHAACTTASVHADFRSPIKHLRIPRALLLLMRFHLARCSAVAAVETVAPTAQNMTKSTITTDHC
jgi:hypothetical protein